MSNYSDEYNKLTCHLETLIQRHRKLDEHIKETYNNTNINDDVRKLKTQKLWIKDEIYRIELRIKEFEPNGHG